MIDIQWHPENRQLRQFAGIWFPAFCGLVGWVIGKKTGHWGAVEISWAVCGGLSVLGVFFPALIRPVFVGLILATFPIGWVFTHVLLGSIFFGIVTPIGLALRLTGHDPLTLKSPRKNTLWIDSSGKNDLAAYLHQS